LQRTLRSRRAILASSEQAFNGNILIRIGPMDADAAPNEPIVRTTRGGRCVQAWEPGKRHRHLPAVSQSDTERVTRAGDFYRTCFQPNR